jgi:hypothetical protein
MREFVPPPAVVDRASRLAPGLADRIEQLMASSWRWPTDGLEARSWRSITCPIR